MLTGNNDDWCVPNKDLEHRPILPCPTIDCNVGIERDLQLHKTNTHSNCSKHLARVAPAAACHATARLLTYLMQVTTEPGRSRSGYMSKAPSIAQIAAV